MTELRAAREAHVASAVQEHRLHRRAFLEVGPHDVSEHHRVLGGGHHQRGDAHLVQDGRDGGACVVVVGRREAVPRRDDALVPLADGVDGVGALHVEGHFAALRHALVDVLQAAQHVAPVDAPLGLVDLHHAGREIDGRTDGRHARHVLASALGGVPQGDVTPERVADQEHAAERAHLGALQHGHDVGRQPCVVVVRAEAIGPAQVHAQARVTERQRVVRDLHHVVAAVAATEAVDGHHQVGLAREGELAGHRQAPGETDPPARRVLHEGAKVPRRRGRLRPEHVRHIGTKGPDVPVKVHGLHLTLTTSARTTGRGATSRGARDPRKVGGFVLAAGHVVARAEDAHVEVAAVG
jgi:hypothetical protein